MNLHEWMTSDAFYWFCVLVGSGMFAIQFCLNLIGLGDLAEIDDGGITDAGNFKWLSRQAITGFLMMFGWSALACQKEFELDRTPTIGIALICGLITLLATGFIFRMAKKLHSNGTVFKIENTIGLEAVVYQRIPPKGLGKISVCVENFIREIEACSHGQKEIPSFVRVKIISNIDDKTVVVDTI